MSGIVETSVGTGTITLSIFPINRIATHSILITYLVYDATYTLSMMAMVDTF